MRLTSTFALAVLVSGLGGLLATAQAAGKGNRAPSKRPTVRIAGLVLKWIRADKAANFQRIEPMIRQAAAHGAQVVCTTECFLDGYAIADKSIPLKAYRDLGEPIPNGKYYKRLAALARELRIHLVAGMLEADGEARYNTAVLIGPDGKLIGKYRKQKLGHESARNRPGSSSSVFETQFGRVGLMICADRRDKEVVRRFCEKGAGFLLCPSGGMYGPKSNDPIVQARSRENRIHIVFVHPAEFLVTASDGSILQRTILGDRLLIAPEQAGSKKDQNRVFYVDLPLRTRLPKLGFRKQPHSRHKFLTFVSATFPEVPGFTCESWCYESAVEFLGFRELDGGKIELRHRSKSQPHVVFVTTVTPEPGAVEFVARAVIDKERDPDAKLPDRLPGLNMCFQLRRAEGFRSRPEPYPEFVKRCFIFTDKGRAFLHQTTRRKLLYRRPPLPADDPRNNPPWVQMYVGVWRPLPKVKAPCWANYSPDRYAIPVIGAVSRDGKYLAALANGSAGTMCQAWHDCLHNNPQWLPGDAPPAQRRWRLKLYVMANDPEALLSRVARDFPNAARLKDRRVPEK